MLCKHAASQPDVVSVYRHRDVPLSRDEISKENAVVCRAIHRKSGRRLLPCVHRPPRTVCRFNDHVVYVTDTLPQAADTRESMRRQTENEHLTERLLLDDHALFRSLDSVLRSDKREAREWAGSLARYAPLLGQR